MKRSEIKSRPLSDTVLANLEAELKEYRELDGSGLYIRVKPDGNKSWQLRYKKPDGKWSWLGLPKQAVAILQELKTYETNSEYLFPSRSDKSKPKSDTVFIMALRRMGFEGRQTPHGFRHMASTLLNNRGFDERHIEAALAHVKDGVAGVYNKAQYLQDRENMMQWYADHLEEIADQSIIQFKKAK